MNSVKKSIPGEKKPIAHIFEQDGLYVAFILKENIVTYALSPRAELNLLCQKIEKVGYNIATSEGSIRIIREKSDNKEPSSNSSEAFLIRVGKALIETHLGGEWDAGIKFAYPANLPEFTRRALEEARKIPKGQVATYGEIAERIGSPGGARAVGNAMGKNPLGSIIPCHRVIKSNGRVGFPLAWEMLQREGVKIRRGKVVRNPKPNISSPK